MGVSGKGIWAGVDEMGGLSIPRTLEPSQHQLREDVGLGQVSRKKILCGPPSVTPHTHPVWAQVWDGNSSNKLGHPLFPGQGSRGGGWGKGRGGGCQLPAGLLFTPKQ